MKTFNVQQKLYGIFVASLLLVGCAYLPSFNDSTKEEPTATTEDSVSEEILAEFEAALTAAVPAALPALKAKRFKEVEEGEIASLTEENVVSIIDAARIQVETDGFGGENTDITKILPSLITGISNDLGVISNLSVSEKTDALKISAEAALGSVTNRQDEKYIPVVSWLEGTSEASETMANLISHSCVSHLSNIGVSVSDLPDSASLIASKIVEKMSLIVSAPEKAAGIIIQIAKGSSKGMDLPGLSASDIQSSIGKISSGITVALGKIDTSKLPLKPDNYAGISENMQKGFTSGISSFSNYSFKAEDVSNIAGESFNRMMEGFSQVKTEGFTFDHVNAISQQASSSVMGSIGVYFPSFKQEDFNSISTEFMAGTLKSIDSFSKWPDYKDEVAAQYSSHMMTGFTEGIGFAVKARGLDASGSQSILDSGMKGYIRGVNAISSMSNDYLDEFIGYGSQAYTGAVDDFIANSGLSNDYMSSFINNSGNFVSYVGEIKRDNYNVESNVSLLTKSVSEYISKGLQYAGNFSQNELNGYIQGMSQNVSSRIDDIRFYNSNGEKQAISSSVARQALEYSSSGFTASLATFQSSFQARGEVFDSLSAQNFISAGQIVGSKDLVSTYNLSQSAITSSIQGGITAGCIDRCSVSSNLESTLNSYYSQYVGTAPVVVATPIYTPTASGTSLEDAARLAVLNTVASADSFTVAFISPINGSLNIVSNPEIVITFSSAVDQTTINDIAVTSASGIPSLTRSMGPNNSLVSIRPVGDLIAGTEYTIVVPTSVKNSSGKSVTAFTSSFTTASAETPPAAGGIPPAAGGSSSFAIQTTTPSNLATNIDPSNPGISVIFNSQLNPTLSANAFYLRDSTGIIVQGTTMVGPSDLQFTPSSALAANSNYTLHITSSILNSSGTSLGSTTTISFTTGSGAAAGGIPPAAGGSSSFAIQTTTPSNLATNIDPSNPGISVIFNSQLNPTLSANAFYLRDSTGIIVQGTTMVGPSDLQFTPSSALAANSNYTLHITSSILNSSGTSLGSTTTISFTTGSGAAAGGAAAGFSMTHSILPTGLPRDANITLSFSGEIINCSTVTNTNIGLGVPVTLTCEGPLNRVTIDPVSTLNANSTFVLSISGLASSLGTTLSSQTVNFATGDN